MKYISTKDVASMIRKNLKEAFPDVKFSVRKDNYHCIRIAYEQGPDVADVSNIVNVYKGGGFDGMIDLEYSYYHYLTPDGRVVMGGSDGTEGSGGVYQSFDNPPPCDGCEKVRLMSTYIFVHKEAA